MLDLDIRFFSVLDLILCYNLFSPLLQPPEDEGEPNRNKQMSKMGRMLKSLGITNEAALNQVVAAAVTNMKKKQQTVPAVSHSTVSHGRGKQVKYKKIR